MSLPTCFPTKTRLSPQSCLSTRRSQGTCSTWHNMWAYAFPLHQVFTKVLTKLRESKAQLHLLALVWPPQPWLLDVLDLAIDHPQYLQVMETLLRQPQSDRRLSGDDHLVRPDFFRETAERITAPKALHFLCLVWWTGNRFFPCQYSPDREVPHLPLLG